MYPAPLIRIINGIETPSPGRWSITPKQPISAAMRGPLWRATSVAPVIGGAPPTLVACRARAPRLAVA